MPLVPDEAGVVRSQVFPGLWLAVPACCWPATWPAC
jgi:hypothetical protein